MLISDFIDILNFIFIANDMWMTWILIIIGLFIVWWKFYSTY